MKTIWLLIIGIHLQVFNFCNNTVEIIPHKDNTRSYFTRNIYRGNLKKTKRHFNLYNFVALGTDFRNHSNINKNGNEIYMLSKYKKPRKINGLRLKNKNTIFYSYSIFRHNRNKCRNNQLLRNEKEEESKGSSNWGGFNENKTEKMHLEGHSSEMKNVAPNEQFSETEKTNKFDNNNNNNNDNNNDNNNNNNSSNNNNNSNSNGDDVKQKNDITDTLKRAERYIKGKEDTIIEDREKKKERKVIDYMKEKEKVFSDKPLDLRLYDILKYVYNKNVYINSKQLVEVIFRWMKQIYFDFIKDSNKQVTNEEHKQVRKEGGEENMIEREIASNLNKQGETPNIKNTFFFRKTTNQTEENSEIQALKLYNKKNLNKYFFSFNKGNILKQLVTEGEDETEIDPEKHTTNKKRASNNNDTKYDEEIKKTLSYPIFQYDEENYIDKYRYMRSNVTIEFNIYDTATDTVLINNKNTNSTMLEFPLLDCHGIIQKCIMTMKKLEKAIFYIKNDYLFKMFNSEYTPPDEIDSLSPSAETTSDAVKQETIPKEDEKKATEQKEVSKKSTQEEVPVDEQRLYHLIKTENWIKMEIYLCNIYEIDEQWLGITPEMFSNEKQKDEFLKEYSFESSGNMIRLDNQHKQQTPHTLDDGKGDTSVNSVQTITSQKSEYKREQKGRKKTEENKKTDEEQNGEEKKKIEEKTKANTERKVEEQEKEQKQKQENEKQKVEEDKEEEKREIKKIQLKQMTNETEQTQKDTTDEVKMSERQKEIMMRSEEYERKKELDIKTDFLLRKLENEMKYDPNHYMWQDLYPKLDDHHKKRTDKYFKDLKKEMSEHKFSRGYAENIKKKQRIKGYDLGEEIEGRSKYYVWTENIHGFTLYFPLKYYVQKKDVTIDMDNTFFFLSIKNYTIIKDMFTHPMNADDSIWSFGDTNSLEVDVKKDFSQEPDKSMNGKAANMSITYPFPLYHVNDLHEEVKQIPKKYFCLIYHMYKDNNHKYMWGSVFKQS